VRASGCNASANAALLVKRGARDDDSLPYG